MTRVVGYTRELFADAGATADADELERAGAEPVFADLTSADARTRPELAACLDDLDAGDVLLVTSSARLSHGLHHFISTIADLTARGVGFRSLAEPALSTGAGMVSDPAEVLAALEGLARRLRSVETRAGMRDAAAAGRRAGRPTVMTEDRVAIAQELRAQGRSFTHIGRVIGVSASAVQRALTPPAVPAPGV
ncbi:recombinase family protein [Microbacterium sp. zg.B48]|uniref:recombinase family protein n=1 Tax=Microbacterium sp. zg.B48 TaxID=2969408 RepID=UPI00214B6EA5|nr:recombinase family protein [Microbacterium sp. zg.B48]MCR2764979.1 recombinase family protein [Microbacterium sp. zg.B48]